jgi:outer membrane receptor protein involved in Fe transport
LELDASYRPFINWLIKGYTSIGDWKYDGESPVNVRDENSSAVVDRLDVDLTGAKIGSAPQFSAGLSTTYDIILNKFSVDLDWNYYSDLYAEVDAADVAEASLDGESYESEKINHFGVVDMGATYNFSIGNQTLGFRGNVYNVFDKEYFSEKSSDNYLYGNGTTWNFSVKYTF